MCAATLKHSSSRLIYNSAPTLKITMRTRGIAHVMACANLVCLCIRTMRAKTSSPIAGKADIGHGLGRVGPPLQQKCAMLKQSLAAHWATLGPLHSTRCRNAAIGHGLDSVCGRPLGEFIGQRLGYAWTAPSFVNKMPNFLPRCSNAPLLPGIGVFLWPRFQHPKRARSELKFATHQRWAHNSHHEHQVLPRSPQGVRRYCQRYQLLSSAANARQCGFWT